ncbi:MAG: hypothetical protein K9G67_15025 [Bacteroidales bacterium]|nr:hypothetical protein [Bacteroidales bacterium]MCF8351213.1 hypothetical protein [Bacteroidales bacterium]MCF8377666.1 hypothetical protein [Bacteroidales bacterium]MCF8402066.1 hypothetical protein [Bacteroidales bacterium]
MKKVLRFLILLLILFSMTEAAKAIPAFARKYRMSCMTCHAPFPKLKAYGDSFAGSGFKLEDQDAPRYFMETGDNILSLIRDFPLAVRMDGYVMMENRKEGNKTVTDFSAPFLIKLLSGGQLSDRLAYYFYFYMDERGEVAGVEDAFLMYDNLFNIDLDVYLGQFQVSDPLFKRELRLELEDYHIYTVTPPNSNINLKYDKGVMFTLGTEFGTTIAAEVINGDGIGEANERWQFDKDKYKNVVGRISQDIGGFLRVGAFAYSGKEDLIVENTGQGVNEVFLWGPDMTLNYNDILELNVQYLMRSDNKVVKYNPDGTPAPFFETYKDVETNGGFAELIFMPQADKSRWYLLGMYNWTDSNMNELDYQSATFHAGYLLRRNVRLVGEITYNFSHEDAEYWRNSIGFVAAF